MLISDMKIYESTHHTGKCEKCSQNYKTSYEIVCPHNDSVKIIGKILRITIVTIIC